MIGDYRSALRSPYNCNQQTPRSSQTNKNSVRCRHRKKTKQQSTCTYGKRPIYNVFKMTIVWPMGQTKYDTTPVWERLREQLWPSRTRISMRLPHRHPRPKGVCRCKRPLGRTWRILHIINHVSCIDKRNGEYLRCCPRCPTFIMKENTAEIRHHAIMQRV